MGITARKFFSSREWQKDERAFWEGIRLPNKTWRTTTNNRFDDLDKLVIAYWKQAGFVPERVLDIAVSSGVTSLEWLQAMRAARYDPRMTATDIAVDALLLDFFPFYRVLVLDTPAREPLQHDLLGTAVFPFLQLSGTLPLRLIAIGLHKIVRRFRPRRVTRIKLVSPLAAASIDFVEDDVLDAGSKPRLGRFEVVRAANILNHGYFSRAELFHALANLRSLLKGPGSYLVVVRTLQDGSNHGTMFRLCADGRFEPVLHIGRGSEIAAFVEGLATPSIAKGSPTGNSAIAAGADHPKADIPEFREYSGDDKYVPLSSPDLNQRPKEEFLEILSGNAATFEVPQEGYRILDFGCGRGATAGILRRTGWSAYGVDVEPRFIAAGAIVNALDAGRFPVLSLLDATGTSIFPDEYFDAVISDQLLEHVANLYQVAREISRVLKPGGITFHRFPARFRIVEPHYRLPCVHWLPKSNLRRMAINALLAIGMPVPLPKTLSRNTRTEMIYQYACQHTFYRSRQEIERVFREAGMELNFDVMWERLCEQRLRDRGLPPCLARAVATGPGVSLALNTFHGVRALGYKVTRPETRCAL